MSRKSKPMVTIQHRKLGRHQAYGLYWPKTRLIELDSRMKGKRHAYVLLHEATHHTCPFFTEEEVERVSKFLANAMWAMGYRIKKSAAPK